MSHHNWELYWMNTGVGLLVVSLVFYAIRLINTRKMIHEFGWGMMMLSLICLTVSLVLRSQSAQYFALSNMYESLLVVSMGIQLVFLVMDRWFSLRAFGLPVCGLLLAALLYDQTLPTAINPLQPALQSYWRSIHVPIILLSYALFTLAFLSSAVYLVKELWERRKGLPTLAKATTAGGPNLDIAAYFQADSSEPQALTAPQSAAAGTEASSVYDEITYRCVAFGFPLLTLGIILGGIWANEAWGNYWSWDPKESMSLVTLLGYGVYIHLRVNGEHSPRTLALVSVTGFVLMLITYFGVNLMGLGLHSYGKIG